MIKKATTVLIILFISCSPKSNESLSTHNIKHLKSFAKIYGYVKYFHPSDEAFTLDWDVFSIYAVDKVLKCETDEAFVKTLDSLFSPIAPSMKFSNTVDDTLIIKNSDFTDNLREQFWFHEGVGFGMSFKNSAYRSQRIIADSENDTITFRPKFGETVQVEIPDKQYLSIPLVVHVDETVTLPKSNRKALKHLTINLKDYKINENSKAFRLGNIINTYNVFQHFFPYFDIFKLDWGNELEKALVRSFTDRTLKDHLVTLRKFTAPLKDGHISISAKGINEGYYTPAFYWEWVGDKLIITDVWDDDLKLEKGDEIIKINGISTKKYFDEINSVISAGTRSSLQKKSEELSLMGEKNSQFIIETNKDLIQVTRDQEPYSHSKTYLPYKKLDKGIHYINLILVDMETFNYLLPELEKSTGLIFDLRGHPFGKDKILEHLMTTGDTTKAWLYIPKIVYPDHQKPRDSININWKGVLNPKKPYLGDKKIIVLADGNAISYSESLISFIKGYNIGTIVGQPTAGTNGNFNTFMLPGEIQIKWTGMKVVQHDGSQLFGIGIVPDVYVEKSVKGIREGRDEFIEKAIELVQ